MHPGDLAGGFSDLEMAWLLYCAGAATGIFAVGVLSILPQKLTTVFFSSRPGGACTPSAPR